MEPLLSSSGVLSPAAGGAASTSGTFSLAGDEGRVAAALGGGSSTEEEAAAGLLPKLLAISSKVLPLVSGTLRKVKMMKMMRNVVKMRKTQGPHSSCREVGH